MSWLSWHYFLNSCNVFIFLEPPKGNLKITSIEDTKHHQRKQSSNNAVTRTNGSEARGSTKLSRGAGPRRHTVGGARSSQEILAMQPSDMDKKREAFLDHLKQKYPHHASVIMGHQERLREQVRVHQLLYKYNYYTSTCTSTCNLSQYLFTF